MMLLTTRFCSWIKTQKDSGIFIGILLLSACMLFPGFLYGLPRYPDADEPVLISIAIKLLKGQWYHHFFNYPGLSITLYAATTALTNLLYHGFSLIGIVHGDSTPYWLFFAAGRCANNVLLMTTLFFVYATTRHIWTKRAALIATFIMSIIPIQFTYAIRITPNPLLLFCTVLTIYFSVRYYQETKPRLLYYAAMAAGSCLGTKYMVLSPLPLFCALFATHTMYRRPVWHKQIIVAACCFIGTFFLSTPLLFIDFQHFIHDILKEFTHYATGHPGNESNNTALFFCTYLLKQGVTPMLCLCSCAGFYYCIKNKPFESLILFSLPFTWFLFCSLFTVSFVHNIASIGIVFSLCTGVCLERITKPWQLILLLCCISSIPLYKDYVTIKHRLKPDIRSTAEEWINKNLAEGTHILREEYTPFVNEVKFTCDYIGICGLAYVTLDSLPQTNFTHVISAGYDRFYANPQKYQTHISLLKKNLEKLIVVKRFDPGEQYRGNTITVYSRNY